MPVNADALIAALNQRIEQAPDVSANAVRKMSTRGQDAIRGRLASGSPLAVRSAHLLGSVRETYFSPGVVSTARVAPTAVYSRIQELGGISGKGHRSKLPPRPYVAPSIAENLDAFRDDAIDAIRDLFW